MNSIQPGNGPSHIAPATWAAGILLLCGALLCGALIMEHHFKLAPCALCLMQQFWFLVAGFLAALSLAHTKRLGIYPALTLVGASIGSGFAIRQLYLQSLPPDQVPSCGPGIDYLISNFPLSEVLRAMTQGTGNCATVSWSFVGISLPGWALFSFLVIAVLAMLQWRALLRHF